jgi:1-deoxy-D-xylulose-5-phosphate reductoisomerase
VQALDLFAIGRLDFERPDFDRFACLRLAYRALEAGGSAPIVLNAANEVAVASFLSGRLPFARIAGLVEEVLARVPSGRVRTLEEVLACDAQARIAANRELDAVGMVR